MFTPRYFREELTRLAQTMGCTPIVEMHLHAGATYQLHSIVETHEGYVVLEIYPAGGRPMETADRLTVAYEAIADVVFLRPESDEKARLMGFHAEAGAMR